MKAITIKIKDYVKTTYKDKPIVLMLLLFMVAAIIFIPNFRGYSNLKELLIQSSDILIVACGMTFVVINGGIDFSMIATIGLGSIVGATIMNLDTGYLASSPVGFLVAIVVMLAIGLLIGTINGLSVTRLKMPSFIATMAVQLIFSGVALFYTQSETITNLPAPFLYIGGGEIFIIPMPIIVSIVVILLTSFILRKTVFGRRLYAIGTNPKTAYVSGLPVKRTIFMLFVISGFFSATGGIVLSSRMGIGMPSLGQDLLLDVFAAVIIGGSSPLGGVGRISGTVFGAIFIALINNSLNLLGIPWYIITIVKGVLILIMVLVEARKTSKAQH